MDSNNHKNFHLVITMLLPSHIILEFKEVRLTGGLDRCSGRVEIHRNGTWGTVCDTCFAKEEANMVCSMLNCGTAVQFSQFIPHFPHSNGTNWYYRCYSHHNKLWHCEEFANPIFCQSSKAAGLICKSEYLQFSSDNLIK